MKRPSRKRVLRAMKQEMVGWKTARFKYKEAVLLDSGVMVLEYETRNYVPDEHLGTLVNHRLAVVLPDGHPITSIITKQWWEND